MGYRVEVGGGAVAARGVLCAYGVEGYLVYKQTQVQINAPDSAPVFSLSRKGHRPDSPSVFLI